MWKELWRILSESESLLDEARVETLEMLDHAKQMFDVILDAMVGEVGKGVIDEIARMDRVLNESQKCVRKKVFEHLAVSKGTGILTGLVLTSVVIDLERIGDYTKNMGEIVAFVPGRLDFGAKTEVYESVCERTKELFSLTRTAFEKNDEEAARESVRFYHGISRDVDAELREFMETGAPEDQVEKRTLALAMLLRYMKRVGAHLKNISTTVSNPFPEIGYRPS
jgi:phosphate uptake regulator